VRGKPWAKTRQATKPLERAAAFVSSDRTAQHPSAIRPDRTGRFASLPRHNDHVEGDGPTAFAHACKMGLEGIVSKRLGSRYRSGRSTDWLKFKNPAAPAAGGGGRLGSLTAGPR
jgi:hypothetical protein